MKAVKSEAKASRQHYAYAAGKATTPPEGERNAFFVVRCLALIFKQRKRPREDLKNACKYLEILFIELVNDMPVRWGSTDKMLKALIRMEQPIRMVLRQQTWDPSVREHLYLCDDDWAMLKEVAVFFEVFSRPTVQSQADKYPTLHNVTANYLHLIRHMNVWIADQDNAFLHTLASAAQPVLLKYYKSSMQTRHSFVATILDPRYKLELFAFLYEAEGGQQATAYKKAKGHFKHAFSQYQQRAVTIAAVARFGEQAPVIPEVVEDDWRHNPIYGYAAHIAAQRVGAPLIALSIGTEADRWLIEPVLDPLVSHEKMKEYMKSKEYEFPIICQMARDYMAIPATSAPTERVFSCAGNLITKKRTRISSENVRYVLCLRSWGFIVNDDELVEDQFNSDGEYIRLLRTPEVVV